MESGVSTKPLAANETATATGFEQVRDVFTLIAGKPNLNLYVSR